MTLRLAGRMREIRPFHVMDLLARARRLEAEGRSIVHMEIGEPDFPTPPPVVEAGRRALAEGHTHYTPATGLPALRAAIAEDYARRHGVALAPERIVVTPGASGALHLVLGILVEPGDEVLLPDPGYPCNRHFVRLYEGRPVALPVGPDSAYQPTPGQLRARWGGATRAAMLGSPSNPTGTVLGSQALGDLLAAIEGAGGVAVVDEIYHGLTYGEAPVSAVALSERAFVINSFSKYYGMTGWRLGWVVAPQDAVEPLDRLAQNVFLAAATPAQHAALAAFLPGTRAILEERRQAFERRRDLLLPALAELGFAVPAPPQGAFYVYADCSRHSDDAHALCLDLLERAGVAVTPGIDFGEHQARTHLRFAYTTGIDRLEEGMARLRRFLAAGG